MTLADAFERINTMGISCLWQWQRQQDKWTSFQDAVYVAIPSNSPKWIYCGNVNDLNRWSSSQLASHVSQVLYGGQELTSFTSKEDLINQGQQLGAALRAAIENPHDVNAINALGMAFSDMYGYDNKQQFMPFVSAFVAGFRGDDQKQLGTTTSLSNL